MDELKTTIQEVIEGREKIGYVKGLRDCLEVIKEYIEVIRFNYHNTYLQTNGTPGTIYRAKISSAETMKMLIEEKMMEALNE